MNDYPSNAKELRECLNGAFDAAQAAARAAAREARRARRRTTPTPGGEYFSIAETAILVGLSDKTVRTQNGYLQYRVRSKLIPGYYSKESTGIPDARAHREQRREMEHRARLMSLEMKAGRFSYLEWFPNGSKADHFRTQADGTTLRQ